MVTCRLLPRWKLLRFSWRVRRTALWNELRPLLRRQLSSILQPSNWLSAQALSNSNSQPPALFQMATGYWLSQAVYVAAKLGVADLLKDGPKPCKSLAATMGVDQHALSRLMRALSGVGVFAHLDGDHFALASLGESLQSDVPGSLRQAVITIGEIHYHAWGSLLHSVQTGSPAFNHVFGPGLFDYLHLNTESAATFNQGMTDLSSMLVYAVLMAYDFSGISSIVDVGGGQGEFLKKILESHPEMEGTVFDLPSTIETTKEYLNGAAGGGRCSWLGGDFFNDVPAGADAYILCGVVHDWDDDHGLQILKNCRKAMAKNGRVLLVETVVPDTDANCFSKLLDLNMLVMTGGRERTKAEFCALFDAAGYELTKIVSTMAPQSVIEGIPR
ncbi:MAG TPA: methyltransferase [Terriglobales bacterium]|nr:methyltransferase [Terriglobales bacterium]